MQISQKDNYNSPEGKMSNRLARCLQFVALTLVARVLPLIVAFAHSPLAQSNSIPLLPPEKFS